MTAKGRTLKPGDWISHYRIVDTLGSGGMGEVYRARDQSLERDVALKILSPALVEDEDQLRRFVREAKSASSLNHPNIVTIHEIGHDQVRSADGGAESGSSQVHFISMELVKGRTLRAAIHHESSALKVLLGWLAQAAEGLGKAHAAGIIHRDLKPGNIMISQDGYAKVLDFGLAKLIERRVSESALPGAPTRSEDLTSVGAVLGTVGYIAPEQVRGKGMDHRADIFSFGCMLYEASTRRAPFGTGSSVEILYRILNEDPVPIETLSPQTPAELRKLIRRCLAKDPNQRLDSMKTLALELREVVEEYDAVSARASPGAETSSTATHPSPKRRLKILLVGLAVALSAIAAVVVGLRAMRVGRDRPHDSMRMKVVTSLVEPAANETAVSADGRFLAYVSGGGLWVRQVATSTDVAVVPASQWPPYEPSFSPDGNYVFYLRPDHEAPGYGVLFEVPSLGGTPRKRAFNVDEGFTFSPDGRRICFVRHEPDKRLSKLIILDLESGRERTLAAVEGSRRFRAAPSWSWDGNRIAAIEDDRESPARLRTFRVDDGRSETLVSGPLFRVYEVTWLPDGGGLALSAVEGPPGNGQLWFLPYPRGRPRRITPDDSGEYNRASVTSSGRTLVAVRVDARGTFWAAEITSGSAEARQIAPEIREDTDVWDLDATKDGSIIYIGERDQVWTMASDGSARRPITSGPGFSDNPRSVPGGIVFDRYDEARVPHVSRVDTDGSNLRPLTSGSGERLLDVSPDGRTILFYKIEQSDELWAIQVGAGEPVRIATPFFRFARFSPDGGRVAYVALRESGGLTRSAYNIIPAAGGTPLATVVLPVVESPDVQWSPDGRSLTFVEGANVFRQRLEGGEPEQVTHFTDGTALSSQWSPDGKRLLVGRRVARAENFWTMGPDGTDPVQRTDFETGVLSQGIWSRDGRRIIFLHGDYAHDVVMIENFR